MIKEDKILLSLALKAYEDNRLEKKDRIAFYRDHTRYANGELTFRELVAGIQSPPSELKEALTGYYDRSCYKRPFK